METNKKLVLLVEDDKKLLFTNKVMLEGKGFYVKTAETLDKARATLNDITPNIIILDRGMPDGDGLDFLRDFRQRGNRIPVLMLTGYKDETEELEGYNVGCDDYVKKPFSFDVLLLKVNSLLRRAEDLPETIVKGGLLLKLTSQEAFVDGESLRLPPLEYKLLQYFVQNESRLMSAERIYEAVWGQPMLGNANAAKKSISELRKKLMGCGYTITNEKETGYRFERGEP